MSSQHWNKHTVCIAKHLHLMHMKDTGGHGGTEDNFMGFLKIEDFWTV